MKFFKSFINKLKINHITKSGQGAGFSKTSEISTLSIREINNKFPGKKPVIDSLSCPYCLSRKFVRRGWRQKKHERVQLYLCKDCRKTFTSQRTKGKHYPLRVVFEAISIYSLGYSLSETCRLVNKRSSKKKNIKENEMRISAGVLSNWIREFSGYCRFLRMREFAVKKYLPAEMVIYATLAHRQLYRYRFHRAKCELMIKEEFRHRKFTPLKEFLELVPAECPHQYFSATGLRASETPLAFSKKQMIVRAKQNYATKLAGFVLQSVKERKLRHEALEKFMLYNDSVTVATEVPVYITRDDLEHMKTQLGFEIYHKDKKDKRKSLKEAVELPKLITGHIDILQIRNGQIHILDYKARAEKEQPIEQLTLYAMALSRLTGLRLFEFKCAWFDEKDYFEFYPLHVLHKPRKNRRRRRIYTMEGIYQINKNPKKVEKVRPI